MHYLTERAAYLGIVAHFCFIPLFFAAGYPLLAGFNVLSVSAWIWGRQLNAKLRQGAALAVLSSEVVLHAVLATTLLGWNSGFQYYLVALLPYLLLYSRGSDRLLVLAASFVATTVVALYLTTTGIENRLPPWLSQTFYVVNLLIPLIMLGMIAFYYRRASVEAEVRMEQLATRDPLTGLFNRRMMAERLAQERGRTQRGAAPFTIVMCDLDHFKQINDTLGHDRGDEVLVEVAERFQKALRQHDVIARWGGEEFLMLLPDTDADAARIVTERLRACLSERRLELSDVMIPVTASFGATTFEPGCRLSEVLRTADEALYDAKASGRNQVSLRPSSKPMKAS